MIVGCVGLGLNVLSAAFVHEHQGHDHSHSHSHSHGSEGIGLERVPMNENEIPTHAEHRHNVAQLKKPGRDLGMLGVLVHVVGDAINNIGVIVAAVIIWQTDYPQRYYADPAASTFIAIMIFLSAIPLTRHSGKILLQSAPSGVEIDDVKHDLEQVSPEGFLFVDHLSHVPSGDTNGEMMEIPGIESVHELHIWRLDQQKAIASAHVVVSDQSVESFLEKARTVNECLHAYGIHSATLQPETLSGASLDGGSVREVPSAAATAIVSDDGGGSPSSSLRRRRLENPACQIVCSNLCQNLRCCTKA